jgi:hypothetical protein
MAAKKKAFCSLLILVMIFAAGCGSKTDPPAANEATELPSRSPKSTTPFDSAPTGTATNVPTIRPSATPTPIPTITISPTPSNPALLGTSTGGHPVEIYRYGSGPIPVLLVGGIHGGYEWNTILLAYELIDYFTVNPDVLPPELSVYVIPSANPDGQVRVVGRPGRFLAEEVAGNTLEGRVNANEVDLNRNWDCNWSPEAVWRDQKLSGGSEPFSEVETRLLRDLILQLQPAAVILWHSAYPAVFPGGCEGVHEPSRLLAEIYAEAAGYPMLDSFTSYEVTGDSVGWLGLQNIPAFEVELTNHQDTDFDHNLKGTLTLLEFLASQPFTPPALTAPTP